MQLNDTQEDAVRKWVAEGYGLTEIQKRLNDEFKLSVTFLDLRFLVLDLGLVIKEQTKNTSAGLDLAKAAPGNPDAEVSGMEPPPRGTGQCQRRSSHPRPHRETRLGRQWNGAIQRRGFRLVDARPTRPPGTRCG